MKAIAAFGGFSVDDQEVAKRFYTQTLGLQLIDDKMGLRFGLPGGGELFVYGKPDHEPAVFTVFNVVVEDIGATVDELSGKGVNMERYDNINIPGAGQQDEKGILRGKEAGMGPDIAWFKDPAGNILALLES
jgi:catechol 2,3-dioxygenase-like lactoylglutathione lyase family enzyme